MDLVRLHKKTPLGYISEIIPMGFGKLYKYKLVKMFSLLGKKYDCFVKVINAKVNITKIIMEV